MSKTARHDALVYKSEALLDDVVLRKVMAGSGTADREPRSQFADGKHICLVSVHIDHSRPDPAGFGQCQAAWPQSDPAWGRA